MAEADDGVVHEAFGPAFSPVAAGAAIALGVASLLLAGVLPVLLASLADDHRLTAPGIGLAAMLEALTLGATTGLASASLKPERLRLIGLAAAILAAAADLATIWAHGGGVFFIRGLAGVPRACCFGSASA